MDPNQDRSNRPVRVLHLEDNPRDAELIHQRLKTSALAFDIVWVDGKQAFESALARQAFDLVIVDYNLPHYDGMSALARVREQHPELPVILVSGTLSEEEAVECLKAGANDYVLKQRLQRLDVAVTRALQEAAQRQRRRRAEEALRESEERFRVTFEQAAVGMALRDVDPRNPRWLRVNQKLCDILGYTREELLQLTSVDLTPPEERDLAVDYNEQLLRGEIASYSREKRYVRKDGRTIWADISLSAVRGPGGQLTHVISVIQDVTERREAAERIARLTRIHALLSGINSVIVRVRDRQRLLEEACQIAVRAGGFRMAWIGFVDPQTLDVVPAARAGHEEGYLEIIRPSADPDAPGGQGIAGRAIRAGQPVVLEEFARDLNAVDPEEAFRRGYRAGISLPLVVENQAVGVMNFYSGESGAFDDDEIRLLSELAGDISFTLEFLKKETRLNYLAWHDALTGLPNRALFLDHCGQALLRSVADGDGLMAVIFMDLARFRHVNETLGRHVGDAFLKRLATRLKAALRPSVEVARFHADYFAFMVPGIRDATDALRIFEHEIIPAVSAPIEFEGHEYRLSARAGITLGPADGKEAEKLLQNAESAHARAKRGTEHCLFYEPQMNARVAVRLTLESRLRTALDRGQFVLHYQPKFNTRTMAITGLEALIRWADPDRGLVPPMEFIPMLEETGMILEAGRWAMRQAASDFQEWLGTGLAPPRIAVNISAVQLRQKDFVETVRGVLAHHATPDGVEGCGLDLEITESLIMEDIDQNIARLMAVRAMGFAIHVDDFGTGYSSLSYISRLPINALKIDRAFVDGMSTNPDDMTIVSTIVSLAHSLNLTVVAEGVETAEQHRLLALLKCDEVQGYLFSKPLPAAEVVAKFGGAEPGPG